MLVDGVSGKERLCNEGKQKCRQWADAAPRFPRVKTKVASAAVPMPKPNFAGQFVPALRRHNAAARPRPATDDDDDDDEKRIEQALVIWSETKPLRGTLAETYLRSRYILEVPDQALEALRFHPACPWQGERRPALIALVRDVITDEPTGIHRTALTAAGAKLGRKMLGLKADGAIKLAVATTELAIAEGVETALSATILGFGPAWSMIDAGELGKFPVLPWIERLTIIVDNDIGGAGQRAASATRARWEAAGLRVRTVTPSTPGHDANNILIELERRP